MRVEPELHDEMIDFSKKADKYSTVVMSIVELDEVDKDKAKKFVEELGLKFRERAYF